MSDKEIMMTEEEIVKSLKKSQEIRECEILPLSNFLIMTIYGLVKGFGDDEVSKFAKYLEKIADVFEGREKIYAKHLSKKLKELEKEEKES